VNGTRHSFLARTAFTMDQYRVFARSYLGNDAIQLLHFSRES